MQQKHTTNSGYILYYIIIAVGFFGALASSVLTSTLRELEISDQELNTVKARFAAEAGIECIGYWQKQHTPRPLNTNGIDTPPATIHCDTVITPVAYTSPGGDSDPECEPYGPIEIEIGPFAEVNDQCAVIELSIAQFPSNPELCSTNVIVHGYSDCTENPATERSLWSTP